MSTDANPAGVARRHIAGVNADEGVGAFRSASLDRLYAAFVNTGGGLFAHTGQPRGRGAVYCIVILYYTSAVSDEIIFIK